MRVITIMLALALGCESAVGLLEPPPASTDAGLWDAGEIDAGATAISCNQDLATGGVCCFYSDLTYSCS